jgi:hypothetical protein
MPTAPVAGVERVLIPVGFASVKMIPREKRERVQRLGAEERAISQNHYAMQSLKGPAEVKVPL